MLRTFSNGWPRSLWLIVFLLALLTSVVVLGSSAVGTAALLGSGVVLTLLSRQRQLPALALGFLGLCLLGYALFGRGFAYIGAPPLFVGEAALGLCLLALLLEGRIRRLSASPLVYALVIYMLIGLAATVPYLGLYGIDALRDAVLWAYGLFALAVAALLLRLNAVMDTLRQYVRFVPLFLLWAPGAFLLSEVYYNLLPRLPFTGRALLELKGGDVSVHLAGIAALLLLGLPRVLGAVRGRGLNLGRYEWLWWTLWFAAAALPATRVRAGFLAIAVAVLIVLLFRPGRRWWKPLALATFVLLSLLTFDVRVTVGQSRNTISAESLLLNLKSITDSTGDEARDGSRRWRLNWWNDIVNYTVHGPYFWTGKGYGINLANADGYQINLRDPSKLRSPHNGTLNILARSGVPGLLAWVLLQGLFAVSLLRAYRRAVRAGQDTWAKLNLWVLAYWAAFIVNASFDVYLEGPQGGIWFWSLFGFGIALLELQRRALPAPRALQEGRS
ncbi:O-antigen ligase family protein [Deinococcus geothermalis]|uniref:O-antigen polymerase related enzyme n=1 Tax=Deinococcus geothermalis (strain DSM 11300 / CIP 105573 / AG-3a) TaxID=319795 RepID=Q1J334_DEIGD|nr:O-antigen ligase family protein [Deinococcus geothermalis]ABF44100.1 O-antigen polymerase related enzyme [Deinococcus geothermalis DSM 11300]